MISIVEKMKKNDYVVYLYTKLRFYFYKIFSSKEQQIRTKFKKNIGRELDLKTPQGYNDKLQWLKLNWYDSLAIKCADKYEVRKYVSEKVGEEILNDIIGVYDSVDEINFEKLPEKFVLKATHGSGWNIICNNKKDLNWKKEKIRMKTWLKSNYYWSKLEWIYKDIKPRIICEQFINTKDGNSLKDYKIFCFEGEPKFLFIASDRGMDTKFDFYDLEWNKINVSQHYQRSTYNHEQPKNFKKMIDYARILSEGFPHVRVDFYVEEEKIIFGELTFFHFSGLQKFEPVEYDYKFGNFLNVTGIQNKLKE